MAAPTAANTSSSTSNEPLHINIQNLTFGYPGREVRTLALIALPCVMLMVDVSATGRFERFEHAAHERCTMLADWCQRSWKVCVVSLQ
jgi:hypothetical protein